MYNSSIFSLFLALFLTTFLYSCGDPVTKKKPSNDNDTAIGEFLSPTVINIGSLAIDKTFIYPIPIYNIESDDLIGLDYSLTNSNDFAILTEADSCKPSILKGKECKIYLKFKPTTANRDVSTKVNVSSAGEVIISIDVKGKGLPAGSPSAIEALAVDSYTDIGEVKKGTTKYYPIIMQNLGDNLSHLTYKLTGSNVFSVADSYNFCKDSLPGLGANWTECLYGIKVDTNKPAGTYISKLKAYVNGAEKVSAVLTVTLSDAPKISHAPKQIAVGTYHGLLLTVNGDIYAWGLGNLGQLGDNRPEFWAGVASVNVARYPRKVLSSENGKFNYVAAGDSNSYALTKDGNLYTWGTAEYSTLGDSSLNEVVRVPKLISNIPKFKNLFAKYGNIFGITEEGTVYAWGMNMNHQTGTDRPNTPPQVAIKTPTKIVQGDIPNNVTITYIAVGLTHTLFLGDDGNIYAVGSNGASQLGTGDTTSVTAPKIITKPAGINKFIYVAAGHVNSAAIGDDGKIYTWGSNFDGLLGNGKYSNSNPGHVNIPTKIDTPAGVKFKSVALAYAVGYALTTDGKVYSWGSKSFNDNNALCGTDNADDFTYTISIEGKPVVVERFIRNKPYQITEQIANTTIASVEAGDEYVTLLSTDGKMFGCGRDSFYQRFRYTGSSKDYPVEQPYMP